VALGTGLIVSGAASAGVVYDLRFADGSHTQGAAAGQTYTLELYARVSGTNGNVADEALTSSYVQIVSTQSGGGALTSGGLTAATLVSPFNESGSRIGTTNNITADGIADWGGGANLTNTTYMLARTAITGGALGGGTIGTAVGDGNSWEFKVATFTVSVASANGGTTSFNVVKPTAVNSGIGAGTYVIYQEDAVSKALTNANAGSAYANSTGVTFVPVPEPTSLGLIGAAAVGLIGRRRRTSK
jgi:hypothetical protein